MTGVKFLFDFTVEKNNVCERSLDIKCQISVCVRCTSIRSKVGQSVEETGLTGGLSKDTRRVGDDQSRVGRLL